MRTSSTEQQLGTDMSAPCLADIPTVDTTRAALEGGAA